MSGSGTQSLFFLSLPDLRNLCCVNLFFITKYDEGELRNKQVKTCRELILLHSEIVASPVLGHFGGITVIMTVAFYKSGIIQAFAQQHGLQFSPPQKVFPAILQNCLSYSLTAKLAPKWNKAGQYLISGKDFLSDSGKLCAIALEMSITEAQLCVAVEANTVRLPPAEIHDFEIPASAVKNFLHTDDAVLHTLTPNNWCHVLPSMKKGQIISISRRIPQESPFQSYMEFQKHWNNMYGYQLPSVSEQDVVYCSVYFRLIGEHLFTYPLCCVRTQPVQCFPRVDLQGALTSFTSDLQAALKSVCGSPLQMTCQPRYYSNELNRPVSQCSGFLPVNVRTENSSEALLNELPISSPRDAAQHRHSPCDSTGKQTDKKKRPSLHSALDQNAWTSSNLATPSSSLPTNVHVTHIQSQSALPRPKLVPVFKRQSHSRHVNVAEIFTAKQQKGFEGPKRTPVISPSSTSCLSSSSNFHCFTPPALSKQLFRPSVPQRMTLPLSMSKEGTNTLPPLPFEQTQSKITPEISSNTGEGTFESKPKRLKQSLQAVEEHAMNSQVNSATLHAWLKSRGIDMRSEDKKEELVSKVMKCLSET